MTEYKNLSEYALESIHGTNQPKRFTLLQIMYWQPKNSYKRT